MKERNIWVGLVGILLLWLTIGVSLPLVNVLTMFTPGQLIALRGVVTLALVLPFAWRVFPRVFHAKALLLATVFGLCCITQFYAARTWGPSLTTITQASTPVFLFLFAIARGRKIEGISVISLMLLLAGVTLALQPWSNVSGFNTAGLLWSIAFALCVAALIEVLTSMREESFSVLTMAQSVGAIVGGFATYGLFADWTPLTQPNILLLALFFAVFFGLVNFVANALPAKHLDQTTYGILALGVTPVTIGFSGLILGERLHAGQWLGVFISIVGVGLLTIWLTKRRTSIST